jgi:branched-chain amino acid transport system ATP-binding protein
MDVLLQAVALRKEFGGLVAVNNVDFTVPQGAIVSLIGPNGAGKTTFFNMLTGVYKPTSGDVIFDGEYVGGKPPHAITNRGIGRTFQNIRLFKEMTSLENVLVCSSSAASGGGTTTTPGACRTATSAGSRWRVRSPRSPSCCCSTSPPPG